MEGNIGAIDRLVDELKAVRDCAEELYLLLDHVWRNREEVAHVLKGGKEQPETIAESITCSCGNDGPDSLAEAVKAGWTDLQYDPTGLSWNFVGYCPACQETERAKDQPPVTPPSNPGQSEKQSTLF